MDEADMTTTVALEKLAEEDFKALQKWLKLYGSIDLGDTQRLVAEKRLHPLLWKHKIATFHELCGYLTRGLMFDLQNDVIEAVTAKSTSFFRDPACFEYLRAQVLPALIKSRAETRELRLWSAGCGSGQEAYSLAILLSSLPELADWKISLLASDISKRHIARARQGIYTREEANQGLPMLQLLQHFQQDGLVWTARPELRERIQFQVLRLDQAWEPMPAFDLIVMRNVLATLEESKRPGILLDAYEQLAADGYLMLGNHEANEFSAHDSDEDAYFHCYRHSAMAITTQAA
jgi:chemotaxis protein methyltransferase CheR